MQTPLANAVTARPVQEQPRKTERKSDREDGDFAEVLGSKNRELAQHAGTTDTSERESEPSTPVKTISSETDRPLLAHVPVLGLPQPEARPLLASGPLMEHLHHLAPTESEAFHDLQIHVSKVSTPRLPHLARVRLDAPEAPIESAPKAEFAIEPSRVVEEAPPEKSAPLPTQPAAFEAETPEATLEEGQLQQLLLKDGHPTKVPIDEVSSPQSPPEVTPELPISMPGSLHLEIQDAVGRWEMDVSRVGNEVFFEFQGDHSLRELVRESTQEISQRLSRHGDVVGAIHWRPVEGSQTTSGQAGLEYSEPREQNQNKGQNRQGSQHPQNDQQSSSPEQFSTLLETL